MLPITGEAQILPVSSGSHIDQECESGPRCIHGTETQPGGLDSGWTPSLRLHCGSRTKKKVPALPYCSPRIHVRACPIGTAQSSRALGCGGASLETGNSRQKTRMSVSSASRTYGEMSTSKPVRSASVSKRSSRSFRRMTRSGGSMSSGLGTVCTGATSVQALERLSRASSNSSTLVGP